MRRKTAIQYLMLLIMIAGLLAVSLAADEVKPVTKPTQTGITAPEENPVSDNSIGGTPVIFFPEEIHDFGDVTQVSTLEYTFRVVNKGDGPLKLSGAKAS